MKILIATNMWPTVARPALGIFVREQVEALRALGLDIDVVVFQGRGTIKYALGAARVRRRIGQRRPDLIHAHYGLTGAALTAIVGIPRIVTFHGSDVVIPWQRRISRIAARTAARNIFVSQSLGARLNAPRSEIIACGVDTTAFRPLPQDEARQRLNLDPIRPIILFAGDKRNPVKDYPLLSRALQSLNVPHRVLALSGVPREEVPWLMAAADVLALTSQHEGSPMAVKEAIACGLPVVSVDVGDVRERLAGVNPSWVVPRLPEELALALAKALRTGRRASPAGQVADFERGEIARRLKRLYSEVLSARPTERVDLW